MLFAKKKYLLQSTFFFSQHADSLADITTFDLMIKNREHKHNYPQHTVKHRKLH